MKDITIETKLAIEMATSYSKGGDVIRSDEVPRIFELLTDRIKELNKIQGHSSRAIKGMLDANDDLEKEIEELKEAISTPRTAESS